MGGIGAADIFPRQANMSVSLAHTAVRIYHLFPSRPITALNTGRVSLTIQGFNLAAVSLLHSFLLRQPKGKLARRLRFSLNRGLYPALLPSRVLNKTEDRNQKAAIYGKCDVWCRCNYPPDIITPLDGG